MTATCRAGCADCDWTYEATAETVEQARNIAHLYGGLHLQEAPYHNVLTSFDDEEEL